jgi:menaquinone-dependent protoporphyrinogen IX oxidase
MRALVVYYSRTGNTRRLGRWIAAGLDATAEEIGDRVDRRGLIGYLRSGNQALFNRKTDILPVAHDPNEYELVVIGTPVWRMSLSSPVRTYLHQFGRRLRHVAFFCTMDRFGSQRVFRQMQQVCGSAPVATLACTTKQLGAADLPDVVAAFASRLRPPPQEAAGAEG